MCFLYFVVRRWESNVLFKLYIGAGLADKILGICMTKSHLCIPVSRL